MARYSKGDLPKDVDPKVYGVPSGIVGLRLYPNTAFDEKAKAAWNAERYYSDQDYYYNPKLVRPYMVGNELWLLPRFISPQPRPRKSCRT